METAFIIKSLTAMIFRGDENLAPNKQTRKFQVEGRDGECYEPWRWVKRSLNIYFIFHSL